MVQKRKNSETEIAKVNRIVAVPLLPEEVEEIVSFSYSPKDILDTIEASVEKGFRFEVQANTKAKGFTIMTKHSLVGMPNEGIAFYSNAPTLSQAFCVTFMKLKLLDGKDIEDFLSSRGQTGGLS